MGKYIKGMTVITRYQYGAKRVWRFRLDEYGVVSMQELAEYGDTPIIKLGDLKHNVYCKFDKKGFEPFVRGYVACMENNQSADNSKRLDTVIF